MGGTHSIRRAPNGRGPASITAAAVIGFSFLLYSFSFNDITRLAGYECRSLATFPRAVQRKKTPSFTRLFPIVRRRYANVSERNRLTPRWRALADPTGLNNRKREFQYIKYTYM